MKQSVQELEEEVKKNLTQESEVNRLCKDDLNLADYLAETPNLPNIDIGGQVQEAKQGIDDFKKKYFGEDGRTETQNVKGVATEKAKKVIDYLFGGKKEVYIPPKKGLLAEKLDDLKQAYEHLDKIKGVIPEIKDAYKENEDYFMDLNKSFFKNKVQAKQLLDEEKALEGLLERVDRELAGDNLGAEDYSRLEENREKILDKKNKVEDFLDVVGFQVEGAKNMIDYTKEDNAIFREMTRGLEKSLHKLKTKMDYSAFLIKQGQRRTQLIDVYEKLSGVNSSMQGIFDDISTMLEKSSELYKVQNQRLDAKMFTNEKIRNIQQQRKDIYRQNSTGRDEQRKRLIGIIYDKDNKTETQKQEPSSGATA